MTGLPKTIKRWCCECGDTILYLGDNDSLEGWPPLYDYNRGIENSYTGRRQTEESCASGWNPLRTMYGRSRGEPTGLIGVFAAHIGA